MRTNLRLLIGLPLLLAAIASANTAIVPVPRDAKWVARHEGFVAQAKQGGIDLLFMGDSITDGWRTRGKAVWDREYAPLHAANFGIGGDRTEHVLWRLEHGEAEGYQPKLVVLMIGTNNTGFESDHKTPRNTPPEVIEGVTAVVHELRSKFPAANILLLAVFPRGEKDSLQRKQVAEINQSIAKLDDGSHIHYLDIGEKFLEPDGTLPTSIMPDLLHPNEQGYEIWADAIREPVKRLMSK